MVAYFEQEGINVTVTEGAINFLEDFDKQNKEITKIFKNAQEIKNGKIKAQSFDNFNLFLTKLPRKLKDHQIKAAYHLYSIGNGANFSVPGSGKTSVVLSVYEKLRIEGKCNTLFIIGPPSCFQPWRHEFEATLGRDSDSVILSGNTKEFRRSEYFKSQKDSCELYLCTFQTALNDYLEIAKFLSQRGVFAFLIVDEAHYMKQIGGSWANSLLKIGQHASYKCILTGTPIPKSYRDIFNLFDFLWQHQSPLTEDDKIQIELWEKQKRNEQIKELLHKKIGPLFYRVRKNDLGLIPPIFHPPIVLKMNVVEENIYQYIKARLFDLAEGDYFTNEEVLNKLWRGRMMRLRQAVSYPKLLLSAIDEYAEDIVRDSNLALKIHSYDRLEIPNKLLELTSLVTKLRANDQKVLIWSNFIGTLELIKSHFLSRGENCELIYGKTPVRKNNVIEIDDEKTREDIRDEFVDPKSGLNILIANPAACAESISLHKTCFHAIYYDLSYNAAQYIQSLDRIHRVGGSEFNQAHYYFLQYENSIDQDIIANVNNKAQKMYDIIEQDYEIYDLDLYHSADDDVTAYKRLFKRN
nr:DEAD/DEAH box helicase [Parapedobacter lycopersici]